MKTTKGIVLNKWDRTGVHQDACQWEIECDGECLIEGECPSELDMYLTLQKIVRVGKWVEQHIEDNALHYGLKVLRQIKEQNDPKTK